MTEIIKFPRNKPNVLENRYHPQGQVDEVVMTNALVRCTKCGTWKGVGEYGMRKVGNTVRLQPQCTTCRSGGYGR